MMNRYGVERGSYIWGRSVHNVRIERLWRDVTQAFGLKWYNFFFDLEAEAGLLPDNDTHIWLLHVLFLAAIDQDAAEWAEGWNHHKVSFDGEERERSPKDMFFFGALQQGLRGPRDGIDEAIQNLHHYGIDWDDLADEAIMRHHNHHNPDEMLPIDHPHTNQPSHLSLIELENFSEYQSRNMATRKILWMRALDLMLSIV
ncbi:hypothetical protein EV361DRAFT_969607 [Lentinula raphanica]|nr:hypothetical protein EV361DRAFT_969607 [Lentinula raphanica]